MTVGRRNPQQGEFVLPTRGEKGWLLELLNRPNSDLAALVNDLKQLEDNGRSLTPMFTSARVKRMIYRMELSQQDAIVESIANKKMKKLYAPFHAREEAINAKLAAYGSHPILFYNILTGQWGSTQSGQEENPRKLFAMTYFVKLVMLGRLDRVRECLDCRSWFLARTAHQVCCSTKCRKKHASKNPDFKKARKIYMRDFRATEKERDGAARKAIRSAR